ncbi:MULTISPECIES: polysaccharide biosynthesis tyrosine autokinase [Chromohalobacter]|uniref:Polysaccharide biosynthesis tyrosine autokinase n=1 Tax=Chromohalobacter moromii TaxID=2860329 RepID=A0A9X2X4Z9_9GAMM|nr:MULTISPECIES: polysaccharide biosynthesis tyrosine autokinase [Chromohalobacter]MCK2047144.1 polysaccharide biosynthesis tyrosine autokinase [Chromohalobacter moromii]MCT8468084.1 polysaccharide biosynthesis tyrosine autokinase [Chromohalobacter canadensis]MCT8498583.1 polysaccharide biosynthesis tyrosine autokinase [Chromohalobacter canadensis]MCT8506821.1 polysaccharide biosynthesis tyrosine autokinase [Chromohalobacter moromii]
MNLNVPAPQANKTDNGNGNDMELGRILGLLFDAKGLVISLIVLFAFLGAAYAFLTTPIFQAKSLVQVETKSPNNPLADASASMLSQAPPSRSEIEIMKSRMVLGRAVDLLNLDIRVEPVRVPFIGGFLQRQRIAAPAFAQDWGYAWGDDHIQVAGMPVADDYLGQTFTLEVLDETRYALSYRGERLGEGVVGEEASFLGGAVGVEVESIAAAPGATFNLTHAQRVVAVDQLRDHFGIAERGNGTGILAWTLTDPSPALAERILSTIGDIYVTQNIQRQSEEARKSLEFLSQQVPEVRGELVSAEQQLNAYRTENGSVDISMETQSVLDRVVNLESQLNELEFSEAEISRRFTPSHPTYAALLEKKAQLKKELASLEDRIDGMPETQQEVLRMQRDVSVNQEIYVQLRNKVQEMQIAEASTVGNVRVLDEAEPFPQPVAPNKMMNIALATLLGAAFAVAVVMLRAMFNRGLESPDQLEQLGLPVYAIVPKSDDQSRLSRRIRRGGRSQSVPAGLLAWHRPLDISIEAMRSLRTSLHFAMLDSTDNRLMIAGPSPGVGKSFITSNLAAVCAQNGQRVLVIDGDMRKGQMHKIFKGPSEDGLSEILSGRHSLEEMARPVESVEGLEYLARGVVPPNASELLASSRFTELLAKASERYDLVIVDSPPVLAVTDATVIGKRVGTTLMVARFQLNPPKEVELAQRRLDTGGVRVKGAILNGLERKAATAYTYGYYNYSYR